MRSDKSSRRILISFLILCFQVNIILYAKDKPMEKIIITSSAFKEGGFIPKQYTCDDKEKNISPPLSWTGIPQETKSIAIIVDDPDAPTTQPFVHWIIYNIPASVNKLSEGREKNETIENGIRQGINNFSRSGYGGPCPPSGIHRYFFKIFALDTVLELSGEITKDDLFKAMKPHIIAQGRLMGKYERTRAKQNS